MTTTYKFKCFYTQYGLAYAPSVAPIISVRNTATDALLVSGAAVTQSAVISGLCEYSYTGADGLDLQAIFTTADTTVDRRALMSYTSDVITNIYSRLGAPAGASLAVDVAAINSKTTNLPSDPADQSLLMAEIDTRATPADVQVSLAVSAAQALTVSAGNLAILAGYTFRQTVASTYAGDLSTFTKLWLVIKAGANINDLSSFVFIEMPTGLIRINSSTNYAIPAHGSLIVTGTSGAWSIAIYLDEIATALLFGVNTNGIAGIKALIGTDTVDIWESTASTIRDGTVWATS